MLRAVGELGLWADPVEAQRGVPGEGAEADDDPGGGTGREQGELAGGVGEASVALGGDGFVPGRGAADGGGDPKPKKAQAVALAPGNRRAGEARAMERGEEEVAGAVAGEVAAGAVGAVGRRGEPEDKDLGLRVAEAGDGAAPVLLFAVGRLLLAGYPLAPLDEAWAEPAGGDLCLQLREAPRGALRVACSLQAPYRLSFRA
jgi:hypothetical protein